MRCPRCGREGKPGLKRVKSKGRVYWYRVFRHPDGSVCVIERVSEEEAAKLRPSADRLAYELAAARFLAEHLASELVECRRALSLAVGTAETALRLAAFATYRLLQVAEAKIYRSPQPRLNVKYALLIIDMLEEFVRGRLKAEAAERIVPNIRSLLEFARAKGIPVIYAVDSHYPNIDKELELWGPHAIKGSPEAQVVEELKPREGEYIVYKRRYDAFFETDLDLLLRELGVTTLIVTGIHTHICVQQTAVSAFYRGYKLIVPVDCVAAATPEWHERGLEYMKSFLGAELTKSSELIDRLKKELGCPPSSTYI